jgi:hypothetical protein
MMLESLKRIDKLRIERIDKGTPKMDAFPERHDSLGVKL